MNDPPCGHLECWEAAVDGADFICLDCCEHGIEIDSGHPCMECAMERADAMNDAKREGA